MNGKKWYLVELSNTKYRTAKNKVTHYHLLSIVGNFCVRQVLENRQDASTTEVYQIVLGKPRCMVNLSMMKCPKNKGTLKGKDVTRDYHLWMSKLGRKQES